MRPTLPLPAIGEVFLDARGEQRVLRLAWHTEADVVVLSLWRGNLCSGSFRLLADDVPAMITALRDGLAQSRGRRASTAVPPSRRTPNRDRRSASSCPIA